MKFRILLFLSVLFFGLGQMAWGQTETITITQSSTGITQTGYNNGAERTWTQNEVDFGAKAIMRGTGVNSGTIQLQENNGVIYNTSALPGRIVSVQIVTSGTARASTVYGGSESRLVNNTTGNYTVTGGTQFGSGSGNQTWTTGAEDDYTFFAIKRGSNVAYFSSVIITYEVAPSCEEANLTFANPTATADLADGTFTQTVTSLNATTPITYESSDEAVATVNPTTGELTLVGLGTTTITANQEAGTHNAIEYCAGTATYELTVISTEPVLTVSTNNLSFTAFAGGGSATEDITINGANLTGNIALSLTGDTNFSIDPNTLSADGGTVTVTYTPSVSPATHSATLNVSNASLSEVITLSGVTNEMPAIGCFEEKFDEITTGGYYSSGTSGSAWSGNYNFPTVSTVYQAGGAIRLGSGSNMGSITSIPLTDYVGQNVTVSFSSKAWATASTNILVSFGTQNQVVSLPAAADWTDGLSDYEITFENIEANAVLKFESNSTSERRFFIDNISVCIDGPSTPAPQISVTPSGNHDFGNQLVGSTSTPETFTIENTGNADLTIGTIALSGTNADQFSITQAGSSTLAQGNSTTFTVSFSPTSLGSKTATVTIPNNDEDYTFTVRGNGSHSDSSDIATNTSFGYTDNIAYANYQIPTITNTSNSVGVFQFAVRDGGGWADDDTNSTTLTDIAFNYTGMANTIRAAALFNGNAHIANGTVTPNGISFSGLSIVAPDNGSSDNITLRVSFTETVTDNQKLIFTVASATADASGSVFAQSNAGGAFSDNNNGNDRNRIEVVADRLAFTTQPSGTSVNTNLAAFVIAGIDLFGNTDADATNTITLTTSGTGMTASPSYTLSNGTLSISDVQFNTSQTGITITATTTGLANSNTVTSTTFDISDVAVGTYRTTSDGTWPTSGTATWEKLTAGGWNTATPSSSTTDLLIIRHTVTSSGSFSATGGVGTKMLVENGGTFNAGHNSTFGTLTVQSGGVFSVNDPAVDILAGTGTLTVENGGKLILNSDTLDNADGLWEGIENFHPESILEIKNWDWNAGGGTGNRRLIGSTNAISTNSDGYYFGHIHFNATIVGTDPFVFVQPTGNHKLCNDLIVNNGATSPNVILTIVNASIEIAGDVIAEQNTFSFGGVTASTPTHTVLGDIIGAGGIINLNQNSSGAATVFVDVKGNVDISSTSQLISSDDGCKIIFSGEAATPQTISIAGTLGTYVDFEVANGAEVHLINQHLDLTNSTNDFTVLEGGSLYFNYFNTTGSGKLTLNSGGILKITDAQGLQSSGASGNVQSERTFSQTGHFHYVGNVTPQSTGNVMTSGSTAKRIVVNKDNATDEVNLASSTGTTNELYIAKGIFTETEAAHINGSGSLTIDDEGYYRTAVTSNNTPRLSGTYTLANNSTIELNANADQALNHGKSYGNLIFSNGGTTTSGTTPNIAGTVTIKDATTLNVSNNTFGGTTTNLTMENTGIYINGGSGVKPDMGGDYTLASGTTIEFMGTSATQIRVGSTPINYANIIVSGTNVTAGTTDAAGLTFQNGGSFTVKDGATFKVNNPDGFTGSATASIKNAEVLAAITLEPNSMIEYNGNGAQTITDGAVNLPSDAHYENLRISGSGVKTAALGNLIVNNITYVDAAILRIAETNDDVTPNVLTARKGIQVASGATALFENNANLMQDPGAVNSGKISMLRKANVPSNQYNYWSSPVSGQNLYEIYNVPNNRVMTYNTGTDYFTIKPNPHQSEFGIGYSIKGPVTNAPQIPSGSTEVVANFIGTPRNESLTISENQIPLSDEGNNYNLIGNPFPSNLDLIALYNDSENNSKFFDDGTEDTPTVYFWDNVSNTQMTQQGSSYNQSNYALLNLSSGIGTAAPCSSLTCSGLGSGKKPNGIVKPGQGFIIRAAEGAEHLTLKNDMRTTLIKRTSDGDEAVYFKTGNLSAEHNGERPRNDKFWVELVTADDLHIQTAVGYFTQAENSFERFDSKVMNEDASDNIYTLSEDDVKLSIQGRKGNFSNADIIPLGVKLFKYGIHKIQLEETKGIFKEHQDIYIKDKYLNITHNLSANGPYFIDAQAGEFNDRFEIVFKPSLSSTANPASPLNSLKIEKRDHQIEISSSVEKITEVEIFNLSGWSVYKAEQVNENILKIPASQFGKEIIIVNVQTESGKTETKKIINK